MKRSTQTPSATTTPPEVYLPSSTMSTALSNTAFGTAALRDNVSGGDNQAFGRGALRFATGSNNIGIGREAGTNMTTGDNVISIGSLGDGYRLHGK